MTALQALGLGVLQGATEFLPVSSSGHLVLAQSLMPGSQRPGLMFDLVLHLATLLAVGLVLRRRVWALVLAGLSFVTGGEPCEEQSSHRRWLVLLIAASVPTAMIGYGLRDVVGSARDEPSWVGLALLVTALLLVVAERFGRRDRGESDLRFGDAMLIGAAQGLAVMPGISRSGSTIAAALYRDSDAKTAVEFSMLVSIPAILGANLFELGRTGFATVEAEFVPFILGFTAALLSGAFSLKALQWLVTRRRLLPFAGYCMLLGIGAIAFG